ncbi:MAG: hypothetical protein F6K47_27855 [Symploca sp. SIO2E6]|nr:hypothetical protein [Symploca sp. SIO2E6]
MGIGNSISPVSAIAISAIVYSGSRCNEVHLNQLSRLDRFLPSRFYCTS